MDSHLEPAEALRVRQRPAYIQLLGEGAHTTVFRLIRLALTTHHFSRRPIAAEVG